MSTLSKETRPSQSSTGTTAQVLIDGKWVDSNSSGFFQAANPATGETIPEQFPISTWSECEQVLDASYRAFVEMQSKSRDEVAAFLEAFADKIEKNRAELVAKAAEETGLPASPRLNDVELPRTYNQLRTAAAACRSGSWAMPTIDTKANIRSVYEALGPICVFGPNNFPFAFNSCAGGDFAAAIAAGNPVIGKANTSHPGTTRLFAELALEAATETKMPKAIVQLIYRTSHEDGLKLVADHRVGATGYTGSRSAGLRLKGAADAAGKPFYAELSSVNPVVILPHALQENFDKVVEDYVGSGLAAVGQMCTSPGIVLTLQSKESDNLVKTIADKYAACQPGTLLSKSVQKSLLAGIQTLVDAGAKLVVGGTSVEGSRCAVCNTILHVDGTSFLADPEVFQTEAFGNAALFVACSDLDQLHQVIESLEGNLTGCIYSSVDGKDDAAYDKIAPALARKVGRFLNDKMPTGVAVSPAMNHGGPYPATGHPGFTAVGIPGALLRFAKLTSFDAVRHDRLPDLLQNTNPTGQTWRSIDGKWTQENLA